MPGPGGQFPAGRGGRAVQFYGGGQELAAGVARFLGEGLAAGGSAVVAATAAHRPAFRACLPSAGGRLLVVDAGEMPRGFLAGGRRGRGDRCRGTGRQRGGARRPRTGCSAISAFRH